MFIDYDSHLKLCREKFVACRKDLYGLILPSYLIDLDNQRIDVYAVMQQNRAIMMALMDMDLRLKDLEQFNQDSMVE